MVMGWTAALSPGTLRTRPLKSLPQEGGVIWPGWGLGGENAVQCAQCCRQAGGADCAESDQEA